MALSGAAGIAYLQSNMEYAKELYRQAIEASRSDPSLIATRAAIPA